MANKNLNKAKEAKKDEFYTQLEDINNELRHYREHFRGKTVLCNCDGPRVSNFFKYFAYNFEFFGLKKLIASCYKNQDVNLFSEGTSEQADYLVYEGDMNGNHIPDDDSNPPVSIFREYVAQLMKKSGIYRYVLSGDLRDLSFRTFDKKQKREAYERQQGICPHCGKHFELEEMEADHIKPWKEGGTTVAENCQMLCRNCNRIKGAR